MPVNTNEPFRPQASLALNYNLSTAGYDLSILLSSEPSSTFEGTMQKVHLGGKDATCLLYGNITCHMLESAPGFHRGF